MKQIINYGLIAVNLGLIILGTILIIQDSIFVKFAIISIPILILETALTILELFLLSKNDFRLNTTLVTFLKCFYNIMLSVIIIGSFMALSYPHLLRIFTDVVPIFGMILLILLVIFIYYDLASNIKIKKTS
ncbi:MAG: hypothetical protein AB7E61_03600 [Acholeplasmataceae bacterium]